MTGNVAGGVGDALVEHFFGADKGGKLTVELFGEFHRLLRTELLRLLEVRPHQLPHPLLLSHKLSRKPIDCVFQFDKVHK